MLPGALGYTRLMGEDEAGTLARLKAVRAELLDPEVAKRKGRIVKLMGDGALVEFPSVVSAVECAAAIQRAMAARNTETPENQRIAFRMGSASPFYQDADDWKQIVWERAIEAQRLALMGLAEG